MMAKEDPHKYRGRTNYELVYPGVYYLPKEKNIMVIHNIAGNGKRRTKIPNGNLIAKNKKTTFKISQKFERGRLMFKVNFSLRSVARAFLSSRRRLLHPDGIFSCPQAAL